MALTVATVETAIESLLTGKQSVSVDGISYTRASLQTLVDLRDRLKKETARATRPTVRAFGFNSMGYG